MILKQIAYALIYLEHGKVIKTIVYGCGRMGVGVGLFFNAPICHKRSKGQSLEPTELFWNVCWVAHLQWNQVDLDC
mgnify:CR=1 FL=1